MSGCIPAWNEFALASVLSVYTRSIGTTMNTFKLLSLLAICLLGAGAMSAQDADANVAITLERTACFGTCPIYTVTILEDGTVLYNGERFVDVTGEQTGQIDPEVIAQMVEAFADAGYFEWDEAYDTMTITDLPSVITSVTRDGETHRITRYGGDESAPLALAFLEVWVDEMAQTAMWTGVQPNLESIGTGIDIPLITMQRTPCFGFCPVYDVALYADGTVAYVGIAHVDNIGVHIYQADPGSIESIAHIASIMGYFGWEDSYEEMLVTDHATVITSFRWEDQYHGIVRYDGDPNAPVGLVRLEDSVDRLLASLTDPEA